MEGLNNQENKDSDPRQGLTNEAEKVLESIESMSGRVEEEALVTAEIIESSSLPTEQKGKLKKGLQGRLKKILRVYAFAASIVGGSIGGPETYDHLSSRYKVEEIFSEDSTKVYKHQDPETTHIINVLSGKESLTTEDRKDILIGYLIEKLEIFHKEGKYKDVDVKEFKEMSLLELEKKSEEFSTESGDHGLLITDPSPGEFDRETYDALWKLEQECGNPKVRFRLNHRKEQSSNPRSPDRSFYEPSNNTSFIDIGLSQMAIDHYIAELSHAKQYNENPISSRLKNFKDKFKTFKRTLGDQIELENKGIKYDPDKVYDKAYNKLYKEPDTLEYEAHQIIQPDLKSKFDSLTPDRTMRREEGRKLLERIDKIYKEMNEEEKQTLDSLYKSYREKGEKMNPQDSVAKEKLQDKYDKEVKKIRIDFEEKTKRAIYEVLEKK